MGKKVKKKTRGPAKEKRVATKTPKKVIQSGNPSVKPVNDEVSSVLKERRPCTHLGKGVNLDKLSTKLGVSESIRCEDCREGAADRRSSKGKSKHGKEKGGTSVDLKSESKAIWVCLECGQYSCGGVGLPATSHCHAVRHARQSRHPLVVHYKKPQLCWCFPCNILIPVEKAEENVEQNNVLLDVVKLLKGRSSEGSSMDVEDVWFGGGSVMAETKLGSLLASDSSNGRGGYVVRGMVNLGNTCFFNSVMQNLLAMDKLRDSLFNLDASVGPLTSALKKLFAETDPEAGAGLKNILTPRSFFGVVCSKAPQFRGYQQHDSHELLRCLLDGLSAEELSVRKPIDSPKDVKIPSNVGTLVDALFGGQISSTVCCVECGHSSTVYEPFLDLSLPVPTKKPPPKKASQVSRAKKSKMPPKKSGRTRTKVNKDAELLPVQSLSTQSASNGATCQAQPDIPIAGKVVTSASDSTLLGPTVTSTMVDKGIFVLPNPCAIQDSECEQVLECTGENTSASFDDCTWLDYIDPGTISDEHDLTSQNNDISGTEEAESKCKSVNEIPAQASSDSSGLVSLLKKDLNLNPDDSLVNGLEEEAPLQIDNSEVLLLPYKESSTTGEIMGGEASSSVMGCSQNELEFDGFGDLFNEPEVITGPATRPSSGSEVNETGLMAGNSSSSDPDEVDDRDSPVSVESCLVHFTKPELLSNENAWHCENCSRNLQQQELEAKKKAKYASVVITNGGQTRSHGDPELSQKNFSCLAEVKLSNGDIKRDTVRESLVSHDGIDCSNNCIKLENGQTAQLNPDVDQGEGGTCEIKDAQLEGLQFSGSKTCSEESCSIASCSKHSINKTAQRSNSQLLGHVKNESEGNHDKEVDLKSVKVKRDATKRVLIHKAPPILTIHLKRFSQDARGRLSKLNGHVSFRESIDLRPYMDPRCINEEKYDYQLVGVIEHSGTMRRGHYVSYVRGGQRSRGRAEKGHGGSVWYHASDAYIRETSLDEVLRCEAYILFYEKT
ncbi:Ubiquitinyl hydrolase 1 [Quillaja saponaria]|uniref:ubiquitinyl hydrolase 1 n=1 Tax=Quillaja saponaria TaxID=32244 RepID=A0AAD7LDG9_QUISA|nr:Ubiquitinyl hydrolase 1 [Quillaja saponaria]